MRVALCLSGHLREWKQTFPSIKNYILDKFENIDVFISTWSAPGYWTPDDSKGVDNYDKIIDDSELSKLLKFYNPIELEIEELNEEFLDNIANNILTNHKNKLRWGRPKNIVGMYYKIYKCNELKIKYEKKNNICYDLVIRCRPDIHINSYEFKTQYIFFNTVQIKRGDKGLLSDLIFCGSSKTMNELSYIYHSLDNICKHTNCFFDPHDILEKTINSLGIQIQYVDGDISIINTPKGYCKVTDVNKDNKDKEMVQQLTSKMSSEPQTHSLLPPLLSVKSQEPGIPIHLRNPDTNPVIFDHPNIISYFANWFKVNTFVEFGVAEQYTTKAVAPYCKRYIGVDIADIKNEVENFEFYKMRTDNFIKNVLPAIKEIDMAFIDANHQADVVMNDFRGLFEYLIENGIIFLHDTYPIKKEYTADHYCSNSYLVPDRIKKEYGDSVDVFTIPIQPGLTIVRKTTKILPHLMS
jgi:hypothetical protein